MRTGWGAAAVAVAAVVSVSACSAGDGGEEPVKRYYVSLGDSLSVGIQPDEDGTPVETSEAYTDELYRMLYDRDSTLEHERMGCGGEDTTTFIEGGIEECDALYDEGSQLAAAEAFLARNRDQVALVTVGIGGNNFTGCVSGGGGTDIDIDTGCVDDGLQRIEEEASLIAERLRTAAGPDVQIVGMTYYNPFVAALLLEGGEDPADSGDSGGQSNAQLAEYSADVLAEMNDVLESSFAEADIDVADVAAAFDSADFEVPADSETGMPANVQKVCDYTWMCNTSVGPDIHTNQEGAVVIAEAFEEAGALR
ncbi:MAG: GDSL-type esterase/lipase family protein [Nocardiopsaceae bacterium]|nr:GDSL-type esterase/lipase family protein [Nocardiopsaceae bacterium]